MSIIENEYNNANFKGEDIPTFYSEVKVSLIDVLNSNEVEVISKDYKDCACKDKVNLPEYFIKCDKCNGNGFITLANKEVKCNKCNGEKVVRKKHCYLCNNESKILVNSKIKIKLENTYKHKDNVIIDFKDYKLSLKLNIYDKDDYHIANNDIYYLRGINYTQLDNKQKRSIEINTLKGKEYVKSEFKRKKEIVCLKGKGIGEGDFYFTFVNEVKEEKKNIYSNVIIDESGYVNANDLISKYVTEAKKYVSVLEDSYIYIDKNINEIDYKEYHIVLNKLDSNLYSALDDSVIYDINLDSSDLDTDRKIIYIDEEKITISYKKNLKEAQLVESNTKIVLEKDGKKSKLLIRVNPYFENVYKIKIRNNKDVVYLEDYKYKDNRLVETFKTSKYLDDYIKVNREDKLYIGNDLILIERV